MHAIAVLLAMTVPMGEPLAAGDHFRTLAVGGTKRSYVVHVPPNHDPRKPTPVVLALHGAVNNAPMMRSFSGLDAKSDEAGFVLVYPNGTGIGGVLLTWNAGGLQGEIMRRKQDDVAFIRRLLDDLATVVAVDPKRVYATGMSNGAMMCYRLAGELSDRIAAIAPVSGTMSTADPPSNRPMPVIHFHGTQDRFVPLEGPGKYLPRFVTFLPVEETIRRWARFDGCPDAPRIEQLPDIARDGTTVTKTTYGPGTAGAEVIFYLIDGGGHTWPGREPIVGFLGRSTKQISANDLLWEFFQRHPMP